MPLQPEGPVTAQGGFTVRLPESLDAGAAGLLPKGSLRTRVHFVPPGLMW